MTGGAADYGARPAEDFARASVTYEDEHGTPLIVEATTSWSYVGAGLRLSMDKNMPVTLRADLGAVDGRIGLVLSLREAF